MKVKKVGFRFIFSTVLFLCVGLAGGMNVYGIEKDSSTPYIDAAKKRMEKKAKEDRKLYPYEDESRPYHKILRDQVDETDQKSHESFGQEDLIKGNRGSQDDSYIRYLKKTDPFSGKKEEGSFIEEQKKKIGEKKEESTIQLVREGKHELKPNKKGEIEQVAGIRYGVYVDRNFTSSSAGQTFSTIYGSNYAPEFSVFYEYQPLRYDYYGSIGVFLMGGLGYYRGLGQFGVALNKPDGSPFSSQSNTSFQFVALPATLGLSYRFSLFHFLRPYIMAGPTLIGLIESRGDQVSGHRAFSTSLMSTVGVAIMLDWMNPKGAWDLYETYGFHHYYLTVDYFRMFHLGGKFRYDVSGVTVGLAVEL